jgi:hypothetical protein
VGLQLEAEWRSQPCRAVVGPGLLAGGLHRAEALDDGVAAIDLSEWAWTRGRAGRGDRVKPPNFRWFSQPTEVIIVTSVSPSPIDGLLLLHLRQGQD